MWLPYMTLVTALLLSSLGFVASRPEEARSRTMKRRTASTASTVTVAPQTALITAGAQTTYLAYPGLTGNSQITQAIQGTQTILPLWTCDPSLSASACKGCPANTNSGQPPCPTNFNYILVVPLVAVVGGIVPPPSGLPTLSIGTDGGATLEPTPTPTPVQTSIEVSSELATTSSSDPSISVSVPCTIASITGSSWASSVQTTSSAWIPPAGSPAPAQTEPLPVLSLTNADPAHPTLWAACGPYSDAYNPGAFYQFGSSFSRNAGLKAAQNFCNDIISASAIVGPQGLTATTPGASKKTAVPAIVRSYDNGDGSGKIMVRIDLDVNNLSEAQVGIKCPNNWLFDPRAAGYAKCYQYFGQSIDYCDKNASGSSSDITWKNGGTVYTNCFYFSIVKFPNSGPKDTPL